MPIANCLVNCNLPPEITDGSNNIVSKWAEQAGLSSAEEHMTINFVRVQAQHGRGYAVMVWLYLPTIWSENKIDSLQTALSTVLADELSHQSSEIQVITIRVDSGHVVENGETITW